MTFVSRQRLRLVEDIADLSDSQWSRENIVPIVDRYVHAVLDRRSDQLGQVLSADEVSRHGLTVPDGRGGRRPLCDDERDIGLPRKAGKLTAALAQASAPPDRAREVAALMLRCVPPQATSPGPWGSVCRRKWSCAGPIRGAALLKPQVLDHAPGWSLYWTVEQSRIADNRHHLFNDAEVDGKAFTVTLTTPSNQIEVVFDHAAPRSPHTLLLTAGELGVYRSPMEQVSGGRGTRHIARLSAPMPSDLFIVIENLKSAKP